MSNLLFLHRCFAYRYAACMEFQKARMLPLGPERNEARRLARALRDLARDEAWLEGQSLRVHRNDVLFAFSSTSLAPEDHRSGPGSDLDRAVFTNFAAPA